MQRPVPRERSQGAVPEVEGTKHLLRTLEQSLSPTTPVEPSNLRKTSNGTSRDHRHPPSRVT
jgi:hypothetical protein